MSKFVYLAALRTLDPKRDVESDTPRALLFAKQAIEYLFRVMGFFLVMCLIVGLTLSNCSEDLFLQALPFVVGSAFVFYLSITLVGIPAFLMLGEIENITLRRILAYLTTALLLLLSIFLFFEAPFFDILVEYVTKLFPDAAGCSEVLIGTDP